jgi:hypothetical protein
MQDLVANMIMLGNTTKTYIENLDTSNKEFMANNHKYAVVLDTWHNIAITKNQQEIDKTNALIASTKRTIDFAMASMQQAQNEINSMRAALPVYCNATRTGLGTASVVCHQ